MAMNKADLKIGMKVIFDAPTSSTRQRSIGLNSIWTVAEEDDDPYCDFVSGPVTGLGQLSLSLSEISPYVEPAAKPKRDPDALPEGLVINKTYQITQGRDAGTLHVRTSIDVHNALVLTTSADQDGGFNLEYASIDALVAALRDFQRDLKNKR